MEHNYANTFISSSLTKCFFEVEWFITFDTIMGNLPAFLACSMNFISYPKFELSLSIQFKRLHLNQELRKFGSIPKHLNSLSFLHPWQYIDNNTINTLENHDTYLGKFCSLFHSDCLYTLFFFGSMDIITVCAPYSLELVLIGKYPSQFLPLVKYFSTE